jgi:hypothetical protein
VLGTLAAAERAADRLLLTQDRGTSEPVLAVELGRMFDALGRSVLRLVRTSIGPIKLGDLRVGRHRGLNRGEVGALFKLVEREPNRDARARR